MISDPRTYLVPYNTLKEVKKNDVFIILYHKKMADINLKSKIVKKSKLFSKSANIYIFICTPASQG